MSGQFRWTLKLADQGVRIEVHLALLVSRFAPDHERAVGLDNNTSNSPGAGRCSHLNDNSEVIQGLAVGHVE